MTRVRQLILGGLLALVASVQAVAATPADRLAALRDQVEQSYQARSIAGLEAARTDLLALPAGVDGYDRAPYFAAFARFRQSMLSTDKAAARGWLEECIGELEGYLTRAGDDAEARALLGSCYGVSTRYNRLGMASRGMEARRHMEAARSMAPANPVVLLQDGMADFSTPALFGGDRSLGISKLERAARLFADAARTGSRVAAWGAAETWQQLAAMYGATGRAADADKARRNAQGLLQAATGTRLAAL